MASALPAASPSGPYGSGPRGRPQVDALFERWTAECDADGQLDFYGLQTLICREMVEAGEVLVIDAAGVAEWAMIGDVLGGHLHRIGAAGIVCDGAVRDTGALAGMTGLSVYSRHINPRGPVGAAGTEVNAPVTIGGCPVSPGDLIIGDDDGLAALTPAQANPSAPLTWVCAQTAGQPQHVPASCRP